MTVQVRKKKQMQKSHNQDELLEAHAAAEVLSKAVNDHVKATNIAHKIVVKNQQFHLPENKDEFVPIYNDSSKVRVNEGSILTQKKVSTKHGSEIKKNKTIKYDKEVKRGT